MNIYVKELRCDWYKGNHDFYENDQITVEIIDIIKNSIMENSDVGPYNIYAARDDGNWLQMYFRRDLVSIDIACEPGHRYTYYNKKYEGQTDLKLIEFDQSLCPRIETCEDMVLAADIFEEWAMHGKRYPTTWVDVAALPNVFDEYYPKEEPQRLYSLYINGYGKNKSRTITFLKKYFRDGDFKQTLERVKNFPILLCIYYEYDIQPIEKKLQEIGTDYKKEVVSGADYEKFSDMCNGELWFCMMEYLHLRNCR